LSTVRKGYYKVHYRGKPGQTLCGKPIKFSAGMYSDRHHMITDDPDEVTCVLCKEKP